MPEGWLEVSNRKVLRPAISTQVFLGFLGSYSKSWDGSCFLFPVATTCFPCSPPLTKSRVINLHGPCRCNMLNDHCRPVSNHLQLINIIIISSKPGVK